MKIIKQSIVFNSNLEYFTGYIQHIINISNVEASVSFSDGVITLLINSEDEHANLFSNNLSKYLPNSIYLGHIQTEVITENKIKKSDLKSPTYPTLSLCRSCLESSIYEDSICTHYQNEAKLYVDDVRYCETYNDGDAILINDTSMINTYFNMTKKEQELLFSIEKPVLKVTIRDEELMAKTGKKFIYLKAPSSANSYLTTKASDKPYLFFKPVEELKVINVNDSISIIEDHELSGRLEDLSEDSVINRFLNIKKEYALQKGAIGLYANTNNIAFVANTPAKTGIVFGFKPFNAVATIETLKANRSKVFENFMKEYGEIKSDEIEGMNLFELSALLLGLLPTYEELNDKSLEFRGNGGVKIDMKYQNDSFDYLSFIGSIMSFRLAGTPTHHLAYSIFESLADFLVIVYHESKAKIKEDDFIIFGNLFSNNVLYSRVLSKLSVKKPYFSKMYALDE